MSNNMNLDNLTVNVRPLHSFQAMDLGMIMARRWFFDLWQLWWRRMLPFVVLVLGFILYRILVNEEDGGSFVLLWLMLFMIYFFRPYAEVPLVIYLSQKIFNQQLTADDVWQNLKHMPYTGILATFRFHSSPRRQIFMPILLLERQTRKERKMRLKLLTKSQNNAIGWQVSLFHIIELFIYLGIFAFCFQIIPNTIMEQWEFDVIFGDKFWLLQIIVLSIYLLVSSVLSVFFVASGFAVYICKRSQLEGWDIELKFRKLAQRHAQLNQQLLNKNQQE